MANDDAPLFSRSGNTSGFGKCDAEAKTWIPSEAKDHLTALAVISGKTFSEYMRDLALAHVYGRLHVIRVQHGFPGGRPGIGPESGGDANDHLIALAVLSGKDLTEYTRDTLFTHAYGHLHTIRLQHGLTGGRAGIGQESDR